MPSEVVLHSAIPRRHGRRRLRYDANQPPRWLRAQFIPGLRPRGSPDRSAGTPARPCAVRRAAVPGVAVPATAPEDPGRGLGPRREDRQGRRRGVVFLIIPIGAPFPDVADHIVKTPGIGREGTDRSGVDKTIVSLDAVPVRELLHETRVGHVANLDEVFRIVADDKQGVRPSTASVFPLRLPWQAIRPPLFLLLRAQPLAERHGIVVTDAHHRMVVRLRETGISPVLPRDRVAMHASSHPKSGYPCHLPRPRFDGGSPPRNAGTARQ